MTTLADALVTIINAEWGNGGGGGVEPAPLAVLTDYRTEFAARTSVDHIHVSFGDARRDPVNDNYCRVTSTIVCVINTSTSDNRLKEIADELRWICNNVAVTGVDVQFVKSERDITERARKVFLYEIIVEMIELLADSSTAYAAPSVLYDVRAALMLGSTNAAYVPCVFEYQSAAVFTTFTGELSNAGGTDGYAIWKLPLPTTKGSLKLYATHFKVSLGDADAGDYLMDAWLYGLTSAAAAIIKNDPTDRTAVGDYETPLTATTDCSIYDVLTVQLQFTCTNANDLEIANVAVKVFYA